MSDGNPIVDQKKHPGQSTDICTFKWRRRFVK